MAGNLSIQPGIRNMADAHLTIKELTEAVGGCTPKMVRHYALIESTIAKPDCHCYLSE
jgi:hypothetical protein